MSIVNFRYQVEYYIFHITWLKDFLTFFHLFAEDAQLTPLLRLGAGACAGIIAMSATYPMDMVRGRITVQVLFVFPLFHFAESLSKFHMGSYTMWCPHQFDFISHKNLQTEKSPYQYRGMFHALSTVLREEGPRALYKGWLPSVIGVVSNSNTLFA